MSSSARPPMPAPCFLLSAASSTRTHWNFMSVARIVLSHPEDPELSLYDILTFALFDLSVGTGSWNRILCPELALGGQVTKTRWSFAMRVNGWLGRTPGGTTTSKTCILGAASGSSGAPPPEALFPPLPAAGATMRTFELGPAFGGQVTLNFCPPALTLNCMPGRIPSGIVTRKVWGVPPPFTALRLTSRTSLDMETAPPVPMEESCLMKGSSPRSSIGDEGSPFLSVEHGLVRGAGARRERFVRASGGSVIWRECPGRELGGHRTLTRRFPACTVNSFPGTTPDGTVTRYT
mmetsp:Transcript_20480/g.42770  ORF Transcript_20480/g.42770 Transcript_20480/m.42770 type:complete len:292 (-) Transcript_20480:773-1648(-)